MIMDKKYSNLIQVIEIIFIFIRPKDTTQATFIVLLY